MSAGVEHVTCQQLVDVLTDYLERVVDPQRHADIERHLVICRGCANYVEQMRSTIELLGSIAAADPADAQAEQLLGMFRAWRADRPPCEPESGP
jgi:predicted anti-sigma-YlaC factor YlaD